MPFAFKFSVEPEKEIPTELPVFPTKLVADPDSTTTFVVALEKLCPTPLVEVPQTVKVPFCVADVLSVLTI